MHILKKGSELLIRSLLKKPSFSQISQDLELSFSLSADRHTIFAQKKMRRSWNYKAKIHYSIWLTIYIYIYREREREREKKPREGEGGSTERERERYWTG
jgi:hypothetical protein